MAEEHEEVLANLETAHIKIDLQSVISMLITAFVIIGSLLFFRQEIINDNKMILDNIRIMQQRIDHIEVKIEKGFNLQSEESKN